jgi:hypothetical protein
LSARSQCNAAPAFIADSEFIIMPKRQLPAGCSHTDTQAIHQRRNEQIGGKSPGGTVDQQCGHKALELYALTGEEIQKEQI